MGLAGIHHVTLIVNDRQRAEQFYGESSGLNQSRGRISAFQACFITAENKSSI